MARKAKASLEGPITIGLAPEELLQLKNICIIRMESDLEGFCRKLILEGLKREATDILSSVALSYQLEQAMVPLGDQETDLSTSRKERDANHLTNEEMDEFLENLKVEKHDQEIFRDTSKGRLRTSMQPILGDRSGTSTGRISSCQGNISEHAPAWTQADSSDGLIKFEDMPKELDDKGLRGGEADEESLQKAQGTERANMHGTRNADLDPSAE